jgi:ArsR family transcriptional regulator
MAARQPKRGGESKRNEADALRKRDTASQNGSRNQAKDAAPEPDQEELVAAVETAEIVEEAEKSNQTPTPAFPEKAIGEFANVFKLLSDDTRLRVLAYLMQSGELNVTDLCNRLGQPQPAVSHHLALLRVAGLIEARRAGKNNFYSVRVDHFSDLLARLLSSSGEMPKKIRFHDFTLTHQKR